MGLAPTGLAIFPGAGWTTYRAAVTSTHRAAGAILTLVVSMLVALAGVGSAPAGAAPRKAEVRVGDIRVAEGASGLRFVVFTVTLANPTGAPVTVPYTTVNGTARAPLDYGATRGEVTFTGKQQTKKVYVAVNGDGVVEGDEIFRLKLGKPTGGAVVKDSTAAAIILNDDTPPPPTLTVVIGAGGGRATSTPAGITCDNVMQNLDCAETYPVGTTVTLDGQGYLPFVSGVTWSGGGCSADPCTVTLTEDLTLTVAFT